jgi:hypothetical protein
MGIEGRMFDWLCNYLTDRKIRVVLNGQNQNGKIHLLESLRAPYSAHYFF